MNRKKLFLILVLSIFLIGIVSAQISYCCEKVTGDIDGDSTNGIQGGSCLNIPEEQVGTLCSGRTAPTSCEATSYCKIGTCIDTQEGTCSSSPETVCAGVWDERDSDDIPQCQLGCCLIGEQAAFVTKTRCKKLASDYGLEINYRTDIQTEGECILSATSDVKGACVYEIEFERNCKMTTRSECREMPTDSETEFHEGFLCSADSLDTICGPRGGTTCVEGRDEVFFLDTCGNIANVYDNSKKDDDKLYWTYLAGYGNVEVTCGNGEGNAGSAICGDCDYFSGSTCKKGNALYGDLICKDLGCVDADFKERYYRNPEHGETWCAGTGTSEILVDDDFSVTSKPRDTGLDYGSEKDADVPGTNYFRKLCYNGEVIVEPCAEYRQEVCLESDVSDTEFKTAACRVNRWQDCLAQDNEKDCINTDRRDCKWINEKDEEVDLEDGERGCVPRNPPGFNFWEEGDATEICGQASTTCVVTLKRDLKDSNLGSDLNLKEGGSFDLNKIGTLSCEDNCECLTPEMAEKYGLYSEEFGGQRGYSKSKHEKWLVEQLQYCSALGDCGVSVNFVGEDGYLEQSDYKDDLVIGS